MYSCDQHLIHTRLPTKIYLHLLVYKKKALIIQLTVFAISSATRRSTHANICEERFFPTKWTFFRHNFYYHSYAICSYLIHQKLQNTILKGWQSSACYKQMFTKRVKRTSISSCHHLVLFWKKRLTIVFPARANP